MMAHLHQISVEFLIQAFLKIGESFKLFEELNNNLTLLAIS